MAEAVLGRAPVPVLMIRATAKVSVPVGEART
jgi:hypothetical protein